MTLLRAIALLAVWPALGCELWAPAPEPLPTLELPPPEFHPTEIGGPQLGIYETSALWLAKCPIGSFYLFGSTQVSPEGASYAEFGPAVAAAYAESQEVVNEIDLGAVERARTIALLKRYGLLRRPATLQSKLSPETWALLEEKFAESKRSTALVRSLQPWLVSFALANRATFAPGRDALSDIADRVQERAQHAREGATKPIVGLRTLESQFQMFAALPRGVQDALLRSALGAEATDELLWSSPAMLPHLAATSPERELYYEHLIYRRNEQMAERLFQIGIDGKLRFVAVGILHLVGERGIPALLGQRGYRISRVQ
jgi:uncharacterized protein YbaP (TraB family)